VRVPSLDFEIPARSQKGGITTVQGVLSRAAENLNMYQRERMVSLHPNTLCARVSVLVWLEPFGVG
jgi:C4-type Zn-finger protein